jgi:hypothetical protein
MNEQEACKQVPFFAERKDVDFSGFFNIELFFVATKVERDWSGVDVFVPTKLNHEAVATNHSNQGNRRKNVSRTLKT